MWQKAVDRFVSYKGIITDGMAIISLAAVLIVAFVPALSEGVLKFVLLAAFFVVLVFVALIRRAEHMARPEAKSVYFINIPCTPAELDQAIEIAQHFFGRDSLKPDMVRAAYRVNPFSFIVIKDAAGKVLGYFDHFGVEAGAFDRFLAGELTESHMSGADFVTGEEIVDARRIYIGGIAIRAASKFEVGKITKCLLSAGCELLLRRYVQGDTEFILYATGFSKEGRDMLNSMGFGKLVEGNERKDHAPLYWRNVSRKAISRYRQNNPICKSELVLKFDKEPQAYTAVVKMATAKPRRSTRHANI